MEIEKRNGKRGVVIREDKYGIEVLTMRNGYQWSGMPMDAELIDMLEQAIVEFKNTQASPASAPAVCSPTLTECPRCHNDAKKCDGVFAATTPPVSEDRKDAERYRAIKNGDFSVEQFVSSSYGWRFVPTEELDSAIDAAMQEDKP